MTLSLVDIIVWDVICVYDSWCYIDLNWLNWVFMTSVRVLVYDLDGISWFRCFYDFFLLILRNMHDIMDVMVIDFWRTTWFVEVWK